MSSNIININNVKKSFGDKVIFENVSFVINEGDFIIFVGKSGGGKTTILNLLAKIDVPDSGDISYLNDSLKERTSFIFQNFYLVDYFTSYENVILPLEYAKDITDKSSVIDLFKRFDIEDTIDKNVKKLSGGEKQRVSLIRALLRKPKIIFCDEPTGSLDKINEQIVMKHLAEINKEGITIIMVTHNENLIAYANRVLIIDGFNIYEKI
ncbi:MAG: ATP-binding cassette domain-containing protein [Acholeplasmatales bacterium]|jgi:putative ABC transport system ATP-binding protein|nr:ATP-binding cassette domain-containing protein [Acholeplasmatales bacterium]